MKLAKLWDNSPLSNWWVITIKIDGVRASLSSKGAFSRAGKPLYNLDQFCVDPPRDVEVYCGSFKETMSKVRASKQNRPVLADEIYDLDPIDDRLIRGIISFPSVVEIKELLQDVVSDGYEGLVLRQNDKWLKVKPFETFDVMVTDFIPGEGKHEGRLGAVVTSMGNIGTGFTDVERMLFWNEPDLILNHYIEVECMHLTEDGMFRHPRFVRMRYDKG